MKRKFGQPTFPNLYLRDGVLSIPGYTFEKVQTWHDTGSMTMITEGNSLKDSSNVLAKIAPANSNGSMCLEREALILGKLSSSTSGYSTALRMIDFFKIPRESGDCVVLLLVHPGTNLLGRYLPPSKINDLLLSEHAQPKSSLNSLTSHGDVHMVGADETDLLDNMEAYDVMDLASFLEFAIQATHCLEALHKVGIVHREVRANAFHLNAHSNFVRFVHFGNRAISLENYGSPSSLVLQAFEENEKRKVKEALCYLAPEQTGSIETMSQDHRTDLYSLGILFWTLLVGRGQMPFEGVPLELLHSIVQKRPMPVHEVRRDVPQVLATIVEKLLAKSPDARYQSAYGLKLDLSECQRRLLATVSSTVGDQELIPTFEIGKEDRFMDFTLPTALYGRDKELEIIRNVIRNVSTSFSRHFSASKGFIAVSSSSSQESVLVAGDDPNESMSSRSSSSVHGEGHMQDEMGSSKAGSTPYDNTIISHSPSVFSPNDLRRVALKSRTRAARTQAVLVLGAPGVGKTSIILANQAKWRSHGLWGYAKFQNTESAPFAALLGCLSSVLRQLMVFHTDLERFVKTLTERLGPQIQNVPLLYQGTPELKDILALFGITLDSPQESLATRELRARFQSLVENVFAVIADTRLFALFLDDLHDADESTLDLVSTLLNSRSRLLVFATLRTDKSGPIDRVKSMFADRSRPTWITVEPLSYSAISALVSKALRRPREECAPLSRFIYAASSGNAFSARNILMTLQRQNHITFEWERNHWKYDMLAIEGSLTNQKISDPTDLTFLVQHLKELPEEAKKYLVWAAYFGETFKVTEVALMVDWEDSSGSSASEDEVDDIWNLHKAVNNLRDGSNSSRGSMKGLQLALQEGWIIQRARDMCSFAHDRYRQAAQAEAAAMSPDVLARMSFRIILMMLHENPCDVYRIAEHAKKCLPLLHDHPKRVELLDVLIDAGESAWARGAHELAFRSFDSARILLKDDPWGENPQRTFLLMTRLAALTTWQGNYDDSDVLIQECFEHMERAEDQGTLLRLRSKNHWLRNDFEKALADNLLALKILGVEINPAPTRREADAMFEEVKNEIMAVGFEQILSIPRATDPRIDLAVALLNDAAVNAYWSPSPFAFVDIIGLTTIQLALRYGMAPGTAIGFFWALGAAAEHRELYRFSADLGKLALRIAERHGGSGEKCRAATMYSAMVSGFDSSHVRSLLPGLEQAIKYGNSAGDRVYTSFATIHTLVVRLFVCEHLGELTVIAEECVSDVSLWGPGGDPIILAMGILNCIRVLGGFTYARSLETVFDTDTFKEREYIEGVMATCGNADLALNWYNSYKVVALYCVGYVEQAAEMGFTVYQTRLRHPNHRHIRYSLFFHSLAMVACLRKGSLPEVTRHKYIMQINRNQTYIRRWLCPSPVNASAWVALVDAEMASLENSLEAYKLYDVAVKLAVNNDWLLEEGWALFLQGSHFVRSGVEGLGSELQRRGIARHAQWGAQGIVTYMTSIVGSQSHYPLKRPIFSSDVAVQTESLPSSHPNRELQHTYGPHDGLDDHETTLSAADLASILKWSKEISGDINLSSALQRLTEIATEASRSRNTCVVITRESGDYAVATSMVPPHLCQVFDNMKSIRSINDPLQKAIIQYTLNSKERIYYDDASLDSRFASEAGQSIYRSVICIPIFGNRGQTFGAAYFSSADPFPRHVLMKLVLLCQQASISISNALLFRSVQAGTRENLKMIATQQEALEAASKSREAALKATKIKSNFLASMSHELRTPFSSFYGLLDLLSGTELNPGQSEIVQTAKQSCDLLLKIIDSILDYSKLEASAVKIEPSHFLVENIIADCMELLLPTAAKKLDLSFNIEREVPAWVYADYARIRQVLMNLIGNAVKFTANGSVRVICTVDRTATPSGAPNEVSLKFDIHDTGIGLSASDVDQLFVPFQQADNSSTRRFGGTGLGLSISRQLVKLMGGAIGVHSELNVGSMFWFTVPVIISNSDEAKISVGDIEGLKLALTKPRPLNILVCSASQATLAFLDNILQGFKVTLVDSIDRATEELRTYGPSSPVLDFFVLDDQSETRADELTKYIRSIRIKAFRGTKLIHLYTPTTTRTGHAIFSSNTPGVVKMTKPPRRLRMLQTLARQKNLLSAVSSNQQSDVAKAMEDLAAARRTLYGNVLVAEDNPIAQDLLVKQLERYSLKVTATSNGEEALAEWEAHEPGYFTVALFDHHMPICDGVEATKRLRMLEAKRKVQVSLPIVALSADCQESTKQLCLSAGMNAFLSKPLKKVDLTSLLTMFSPPQIHNPS